MSKFTITLQFANTPPKQFTDKTAPNWLKYGGPKGSTMDNRWFWNDHVLKLKLGESISTDFTVIKRIE